MTILYGEGKGPALMVVSPQSRFLYFSFFWFHSVLLSRLLFSSSSRRATLTERHISLIVLITIIMVTSNEKDILAESLSPTQSPCFLKGAPNQAREPSYLAVRGRGGEGWSTFHLKNGLVRVKATPPAALAIHIVASPPSS